MWFLNTEAVLQTRSTFTDPNFYPPQKKKKRLLFLAEEVLSLILETLMVI